MAAMLVGRVDALSSGAFRIEGHPISYLIQGIQNLLVGTRLQSIVSPIRS